MIPRSFTLLDLRLCFLTGNAPRAIETVQKALALLPPGGEGRTASKTRKVLEASLARYKGRIFK